MENLVRYGEKYPLCSTPSLGRKIDYLLDNFCSGSHGGFFKHHHFKEPRVNVLEGDKAYYVEVALAGFKKENVKLWCDHNVLSIEAKKEEKKEESRQLYYHCAESHCCGSFFKSFQLPENTNTSKIDAEMKDGLLKITLPKSETKTSIAIR